MDKKASSSYSLLDYFNLPYPSGSSRAEKKMNGNLHEVLPLYPTPHIEIQLSLFDEINE